MAEMEMLNQLPTAASDRSYKFSDDTLRDIIKGINIRPDKNFANDNPGLHRSEFLLYSNK